VTTVLMPSQTHCSLSVMLNACQNQASTSIRVSLLYHCQENAQRQRLDHRIVFEVIAQPLGNRQHPLGVLATDQTDVANRFAILMVSVRIGERALPLAWWVKEGAADLGFDAQRELLEKIRASLPAGASVLMSADRFYGTADLLRSEGGWIKPCRKFTSLLPVRQCENPKHR
jgi:hypothetical protein